MEEEHRGLGGGGGWAGFHTLVYDPKLAAGRGVEFSAAAQAGDVSPAAVQACCCGCCPVVADGTVPTEDPTSCQI